MPVSAAVKYYAIVALTILLSLVTYFSDHPALTETTLIGAALVAIPLAIHDLEAPGAP